MDGLLLGCLGFAALFALIVLGVPIAFAAAFVGTVGLLVGHGPDVTFHFLSSIPYSEVASYAYTTS